MSRLRIRTPSGNWLDICDSEWYVRDAENKNWIRLVVSKEMKVRHGGNSYWLDIECDTDSISCAPADGIRDWPGYSGNFDNHTLVDAGATGSMLCDINGQNCVSYHGPGFQGLGNGSGGLNTGGYTFHTAHGLDVKGSYEKPQLCPVTLYGGVAIVSEFYVDCTQIAGLVYVNFRAITGSIRVRVYKGSEILADSNSTAGGVEKSSNGKFGIMSFTHNTADGDGIVLVRVDASSESVIWEVSVACTNLDEEFSVLRPAPAFGTYPAKFGCGPRNTIERFHALNGSGATNLDLVAGTGASVKLSVFYQGTLVATTTNFVSGTVSLKWNFVPKNGDNLVLVRVEASGATDDWGYSIYNPGQLGGRNSKAFPSSVCPPTSCDGGIPEVYAAKWRSTGANETDVWFDFTGQAEGFVRIPFYFASGTPKQLLVYHGTTLKAATEVTTGSGSLVFFFKKSLGNSVRVRVVGTCCPSWWFVMPPTSCFPTVCIDDASITRSTVNGATSQMCFTVSINSKVDKAVKVDYVVSSSNAIEQSSATTGGAPADYINNSGSVTIPACASSAQICVTVLGTNRAGSTRTLSVELTGADNAMVCTDNVGVGTIYNSVDPSCPQSTSIEVKDGGLSGLPGGARYMYCSSDMNMTNYNFSAVLDVELYIETEGVYTFYLLGDDVAYLYVDCVHILTAGSTATSVTYWLPKGNNHVVISYANTAGPQKNPSYCSMAVVRSDGVAVYGSNASHWKGRIIDAGIEPSCNQITGGYSALKAVSSGYNSLRSYGAAELSPIVKPSYAWTTSERDFYFPVTGTYTIKCIADDAIGVIVNCNLVGYNDYFYSASTSTAVIAAGTGKVVLRTYNARASRAHWFAFAIIAPDGTVVAKSDSPELWKNRTGDVDWTNIT